MKRKFYIAFLCIISATLTGCGKQQNMEPVTSQTQESTQVVEESVSIQQTKEVKETTELSSTELEEPIQNANIDKLLGQWKVTEFALIEKTQILPSYWIMEHFIGRSIIFEEDQIIISFGAWYNNPDYVTRPIIQVGMNLETGEEVGIRHDFRDEWYDEFSEKMMEVYTFLVLYENYDGEKEYLITEDGKVLCDYLGAYYYMEPYIQAKTDVQLEQLHGNWQVERLVSYQNGWKGNNEHVSRVASIDKDTVYTEEEGGNFSPLDYYNATFNLTEDSATLRLEDGTTEQYAIHLFGSQTVDTVSYEEEKGIHDRLGVTNEDILVYTANIDGQKDQMLWNGDVIVVDENRIIVKLYQGWYMLVRE